MTDINITLDYYERESSQLSIEYERANISELHQLLLNTFNNKDKLLEIGCGSGRDASFLNKKNYDVVAIDGSQNMIKEAKKFHPEMKTSFICKNIPNELSFEKTFDGIYSIATLMHLNKQDLERTLLLIYNLLNFNGRFLLSIAITRDDINKDGLDKNKRYFLILEEKVWIGLCQNIGFKLLSKVTRDDGLNRKKIKWLTLILEKGN